MIWVNAVAAFGVLAAVVPVLIHLLARQRAPRMPFPTLRFIRPYQAAAVRRRALDDLPLLAVRCTIVGLAALAFAGPLLITAARRKAWDARTMTADVTGDLRGGMGAALAWLDAQPPGRRAIRFRSAFPIGSLDGGDLAAVPRGIGLRFERTAALPPTRTVRVAPVIDRGTLIERAVTLDGPRTRVSETRSNAAATLPVAIEGPDDGRAAVDRLAAMLALERLPAAADNHRARVVFGAGGTETLLTVPWATDAAARVARSTDPGLALRFEDDGDRLSVMTPMAASDPRALRLALDVAAALAPPADHLDDEVVAIADDQLRAWAREPGPAPDPDRRTIDRDDRRWVWGAVLMLLALEAWMRRSRSRAVAQAAHPAEVPRVA